MKNIAKIVGLSVAALLILGSCKEDQLLVYDHENNIYFQHKKWPSSPPNGGGFSATMKYGDITYTVTTSSRSVEVLDSLSVSMAFLNPEIPSETTFLPVMMMGEPVGYDRKIAWKQINPDDPNAATEGVDFRVLDAFIPAGKVQGGIIIEMFRANLQEPESYLVADFELVANDDFSVNFNTIPRSEWDDTLTTPITMRLKYTDGLTPPMYWAYGLQNYLGPWSTKKAFVIHDELGASWDFIYSYDNGVGASAMGFAFKRWLQTYKDNNGGVPMYEADGTTEMVAGTMVNN